MSSTPHFLSKIAWNATSYEVLRIPAATIGSIRSGELWSFAVILSAKSRSIAAALPNQLKLITKFQSARAALDSLSKMDKALANLAILGRRLQKTPISLVRKGRG